MNEDILVQVDLERVDGSNKQKKNFAFLDENTKVGNRNKLGGMPDGLPIEHFPSCPVCKKRMKFYGQLDSINDKYMIGDCFLILVFLCFDCYETKSVVHNTLV